MDLAREVEKKDAKLAKELFFKAAEAYEEVANTPSLMGDGQALALDMAINYYTLSGFGKPGYPDHPERSRRAVQLLHQRLKMTNPGPSWVWPIYVGAARDAGEYGYALFLLDEWQRLYPADAAKSEAWRELQRERVMELQKARRKAAPKKGGEAPPKDVK